MSIFDTYHDGLQSLAQTASMRLQTVVGAHPRALLRPVNRAGSHGVPGRHVAQSLKAHKKSIQDATATAKKAIAVGKAALNALKKKSHKVRTKTVGKSLSDAALKKIASSLVSRGTKLLKQAQKHQHLVTTATARQKAGEAKVQKELQSARMKIMSSAVSNLVKSGAKVASTHAMLSSHPLTAARTHVTGENLARVRDFMGACFKILGDDPTVPADPSQAPPTPTAPGAPTSDPSTPGLMSDGTVDPSYISAAMLADPDVWQAKTALQNMPPQPTADLMETTMKRDPSTYTPDPYGPKYDKSGNATHAIEPWNDPIPYKFINGAACDANGNEIKMAFLYDDAPPLRASDQASIASAQRFNDVKDVGMSINNSAAPRGTSGMTSGFQLSSDGWQTYYAAAAGGRKYSPPNAGEMADLNTVGIANGWGPLIGRPNSPYAGLRMATDSSGNQCPFFFYDTAPKRFRDIDDGLRLAQAVTDWQAQKETLNTALATALVNAQLKQQQDADAATAAQQAGAAQDAANQQQQQQWQQDEQNQQAQLDQQSQATAEQEQAAQQQQMQQIDTDTQAQAAQNEADADAYQKQLDEQFEQRKAQDAADLQAAMQADASAPDDTDTAPRSGHSNDDGAYATADDIMDAATADDGDMQ